MRALVKAELPANRAQPAAYLADPLARIGNKADQASKLAPLLQQHNQPPNLNPQFSEFHLYTNKKTRDQRGRPHCRLRLGDRVAFSRTQLQARMPRKHTHRCTLWPSRPSFAPGQDTLSSRLNEWFEDTIKGAIVTSICLALPSYSTHTLIALLPASLKLRNVLSVSSKYPADFDTLDIMPLMSIPTWFPSISRNSLVCIVSSSTATTWLVDLPLLLPLNRPRYGASSPPGRPPTGEIAKVIPWPSKLECPGTIANTKVVEKEKDEPFDALLKLTGIEYKARLV
nr:hypothetical protein ACMD2_24840 [Ipomoea trifida]